MNIQINCYATLARFKPDNANAYPVTQGETVGDVMARLGVAQEDVKLIFLNGVKAEPDAALSDGDRVGLFPAVGGG